MSPTPQTPRPTFRESVRQFRRLVVLIRAYLRSLVTGVVLGIMVGVVGLATPYLSKLLIDEVFATKSIELMHVLVGGIFAVSVTTLLLGGIRAYYTLHVGAHLSNATTLMFFNHLQHLSARFYERHRVGEVLSRFGDVRTALSSVSDVVGTVLTQGLYVIVVPPFLFLLEWRLALIAVGTLPLTVAITWVSATVLRRYHERSAEAYAELSGYQVEVLSHIRTLKVLALERRIFARAQQQVREGLDLQLRAGIVGQGFALVNGVVGAVGTAFFTWFGWRLIIEGQMTLGDYIAFMAYLGYLTGPVLQLTGIVSRFQRTAVSLGRMFEYLDEPTEQNPASAYALEQPSDHRIRGRVELRGISFGYAPGAPILRDVDLELPQGSVTALVGASGAGKSSLLRILARLEEPDEGIVLVDGCPASSLEIAEYRRQIAVVWQDSSLMQGTLWDNLTLGAEDVSVDAVDAAVRSSRLEALVAGLPLGYRTPVGEWGATLSGGQRQRISIARAILRDSPILLLDEATSNVDLETEDEIFAEMLARRGDRTILFVTHRLSTAAWADQVCILHEGRVAAVGTHEHLVRTSALYNRLYGSGSTSDARHLRVMDADPHLSSPW